MIKRALLIDSSFVDFNSSLFCERFKTYQEGGDLQLVISLNTQYIVYIGQCTSNLARSMSSARFLNSLRSFE